MWDRSSVVCQWDRREFWQNRFPLNGTFSSVSLTGMHNAHEDNLLKTTWGPTTKAISGLGPYLKQVPMAEGNVANRNGVVMGKGVMGLSTLLFSRNVVVVMPKKSRISVWGLLCK